MSGRTPGGRQTKGGGGNDLEELCARLRSVRRLEIVLDYDGTLVPFADHPEDAAPDCELLRLLARLAQRPGTRVHVISGRSKESLERWLGHLPAGLYAEHGYWERPVKRGGWRQTQHFPDGWKEKIRPILEQFVETTRGSFVEEKSASLVWHYRRAERRGHGTEEYGELRARELRAMLGDLFANEPIEVIAGSKAVEVRSLGVHKGTIVPFLAGEDPVPAVVLAIGDDRTDEDLFAALPPDAACVHVGDGESIAQYRVRDVPDVRRLLFALLAP